MSLPTPSRNERRTADLLSELESIASVMVPEWRGAGVDGDFGNAFFNIAARLAGEVTERIDQTPERDPVAFFSMLDLPADAPYPARVPLVFVLGEKQEKPVLAPAATQVSATTDRGNVIFETARPLKLTPARLKVMAAVDGDDDRIELAPTGFVELEPPAELPDFVMSSFAGTGSRTIQVEPAEGLEENDLVRIKDVVYRLGEGKDGLFALQDPLETDVDQGAPVEKITRFETFRLRNLQEHLVYLGHAELLNLESQSSIIVDFAPASVAAQLVDVTWELYGTPEGGEQGWTAVIAEIGNVAGQLILRKTWKGSVDEAKVDGEKSRWLRARHANDISGAVSAGTRVRTIGIRVETGHNAVADQAEGSSTIKLAFHNATPLPLTTRFLPFGPEPQRFDTFALAAPEALSKEGASVKLHVRLPDASILAMDVAQTTDGPTRAYTVAGNGQLQVLAFDENDDALMWQELGQPEPPDVAASGADDGDGADPTLAKLELDARTSPQAIQLDPTSGTVDLVVGRDRRGALWAHQISISGDTFESGPWIALMAPGDDQLDDPEAHHPDLVLLRRDETSTVPSYAALLLTVSGDKLRRLALSFSGGAIAGEDWKDVTPQNASSAPTFGPATRIVPVLGTTWPTPGAFPHEILVLDDNGALWTGEVHIGALSSVDWQKVELPTGSPNAIPVASPGVRPAAARPVDELVVFAAKEADGKFAPFVLRAGTDDLFVGDPNKPLTYPSPFQCHPTALGVSALGSILGTNRDGEKVASLWTIDSEDGLLAELPVPAINAAVPPRGMLFPLEGAVTIVTNGKAETIQRRIQTERVDLAVHHAIIVAAPAEGAHFVEPDVANNASQAVFPTSPVITAGGNVVFSLSGDAEISPGTEPQTGDWKLWPSDGDFTGTADQTTPAELTVTHGSPNNNDELVIGGRRYSITGLVSGVATLDADIPLNLMPQVPYSVLRAGTGVVVTVIDEHMKSLMLLTGASQAPSSNSLVYARQDGGVPAPRRRSIELANRTNGEDWILLEGSWSTPPSTAALQADLFPSTASTWSPQTYERGYQNPELAWEYHNGASWRRLEDDFVDSTNHLSRTGDVKFKVPSDLNPGEVAGQKDYWIRARLVGGDYGRPQFKVVSDDDNGTITQTINVDTSKLQPPEITRINASFTMDELGLPELVLVKNNLDLRNQTQAMQVTDAEIELFEGARGVNGDATQRVLYLGFTKPFDVRPLSIFVDAEEQDRDVVLEFEVRDQNTWRHVAAEDGTHGFHRRGFVDVTVDIAPSQARLFGEDLHWLRVRQRDADAAWAPTLRGLFVNAGLAEQAKTVEQELLGSSTGEPGLRFTLANAPVLPDSLRLRVRESLSDEDRAALAAGDDERDEDEKRVTRDDVLTPTDDWWVLWERVDSFIDHGRDARVFRLDPKTGEIRFGDGTDTKTPPPGRDNVRAMKYQTGGGVAGNVEAFTIESLKSAVKAVETVANPIEAAGGTDAPPLDVQIASAPSRLRRGGQAITPPDIEALAVASSPEIVRARCLRPASAGAPIRVAVVMRSGERCPQLTLAERDELAARIRDAAWGALGEDDLEVRSPDFVRVRVDVELRATAASEIAALEDAARTRLRELLDPVEGGPDGDGWPFARRIWNSDVLRALSEMPGLDRIESVQVEPETELEQMSEFAVVCAEEDDLRVVLTLGEGER